MIVPDSCLQCLRVAGCFYLALAISQNHNLKMRFRITPRRQIKPLQYTFIFPIGHRESQNIGLVFSSDLDATIFDHTNWPAGLERNPLIFLKLFIRHRALEARLWSAPMPFRLSVGPPTV